MLKYFLHTSNKVILKCQIIIESVETLQSSNKEKHATFLFKMYSKEHILFEQTDFVNTGGEAQLTAIAPKVSQFHSLQFSITFLPLSLRERLGLPHQLQHLVSTE
jgi:hypothetical protein